MINYDDDANQFYEGDGDPQQKNQNNQSDYSEIKFQINLGPHRESQLQYSQQDGQINMNIQDQNSAFQLTNSLLFDGYEMHDKMHYEKFRLLDHDLISTQNNNTNRNGRQQIQVELQQQCIIQDTKNLPGYFIRVIRKYVKTKRSSLKLIKTKTLTLSSLRELLRDEDVNVLGQQYLTSYKFLDDLLRSEKQLDIAPPIKYLKKVYTECVQPDSLYNWKD